MRRYLKNTDQQKVKILFFKGTVLQEKDREIL